MGCGEREVCRCSPPLSVGLYVPANLMPDGNMVCRREDVAGSISQEYSRDTPSPSTAPVRKCEHRVCISLANVVGAAYSSCLHRQLVPFYFLFFFYAVISRHRRFESRSKVLSVKNPSAANYFLHTQAGIPAL